MSIPQYTYRDYYSLIEMWENQSLNSSDSLIKIIKNICKYIFADAPEDILVYDTPKERREKALDSIPPKHETLAMVMTQPYKMYMYDTQLEDIPLEICNTFPWVDTIVKWRLKIGK